MNVIVLLADGVRADTMRTAIASGALPALARLRAEGGLYDVTSCFPTVTGPAYAPMLLGRFPGGVGLPGIRWHDRSRTVCRWPDYSRSYVGYQFGYIDQDLDPNAPTIFELEPNSAAAMSVIMRGLPRANRFLDFTPSSMWRAARTHFMGGPRAMFAVDRDIADEVVSRAPQCAYVFAAFGGADKVSHAEGQASPGVVDALRIVDDAVARVRAELEHRGAWERARLWITSDHGHSDVSQHEDLAGVVESQGHRVLAHPMILRRRPDLAVMVSGNAMAHVYVDLSRHVRPLVDDMSAQSRKLMEALTTLPSVDLLMARRDASTSVVIGAAGRATVTAADGRYSYQRESGDPLGLGADLRAAPIEDAYAATLTTEYPDSLVQITALIQAPRSGDILLSASPGWDFRARFEPTPHRSTHGSLRRAHMLVPLLASHRPAGTPRRTTDVFASTLAALGRPVPSGLDGESFA